MSENQGFTSVVGGWQCGQCGSIVPDPYVPRHTCSATGEPKPIALALHLKVSVDSIEACRYSDDCFECEFEPGQYLVLTESEREAAADDALESYIDDGLFAGIETGAPFDTLRQYFDRAAWKRDALMSDGYGHTLSPYDGQEHEYQLDGEWFYIYRVN